MLMRAGHDRYSGYKYSADETQPAIARYIGVLLALLVLLWCNTAKQLQRWKIS